MVFLGVVSIWSTTPLAIVWSTLGSSASFAVTARMILGLVLCWILFVVGKKTLNTSKQALKNYVFAGLGIFVTMSLIYHAARNIDSGIISIIFGLTPIATGVFSYFLMRDSFFKFGKILGLLLSFLGLILVFLQTFNQNNYISIGLLSAFLGMGFQAFISVKIKQINAPVSALETTLGALIVSTPLFVLSFFITEGSVPIITLKSGMAIVYLSIFGSVLGFIAYYYLIQKSSVHLVGIIPLITPIFALLLGGILNQETLTTLQVFGVGLVLIGLGIYQYGAKLWQK
jgi:drug/metabolite transporter (DMT)-like permease